VRVTKSGIEAWIGDEQLVDVPAKDRKFSIRMEVERSRPLGIACWETTAGLRDIKLRRLDAGPPKAVRKR
jgi:hypothetical protein